MKVELDLSNYAGKSNLNSTAGSDTSKLAKNADLARLKLNIYDLDNDKLKTVPIDSYKLSNVVGKKILYHVLNSTYHELVNKVSAFQTSDTSDLIKEADFNTKVDEIEKKIPIHDKYITI